jgi:TetR/AcrR family transcriptional regulator, lmrAB and yxaGH operons repressor
MSRRPKHREAIVTAALTLFRRQGYAATGLNDIVALSGAPKGSLYHYFPEGKLSIAEAAVRQGGENVTATLRELARSHKTPAKLVRGYAKLLGKWMAKSRFRDGSAISSTLQETAPDHKKITAAGIEAFASWRVPIIESLEGAGVSKGRAERLATLVVAALEGSLVQARVEQSSNPIKAVAQELEELLKDVSRRADGSE